MKIVFISNFEIEHHHIIKSMDNEFSLYRIIRPVYSSGDDENNFSEILKKYFDIGFNSKYVISTPVAQPKIFEENGYFPVESIKTDGFTRGIYNNISNEDLVSFSCFEHEEPCIKSGKTIVSKKVVRSFMIGRD